jgi:hypothetical protein
MRGLKRQKQSVYWSRVTEELDGIDTVPKYQKPERHFLSVSSTAGTPEELSAGIMPDYDRYITNFDRAFQPQTADVFWIDNKPELNNSGELVLDEDGAPTVSPDYRLKKILDTQKGNIARYGLKYIGDSSDVE